MLFIMLPLCQQNVLDFTKQIHELVPMQSQVNIYIFLWIFKGFLFQIKIL